MDIGSSTGGFTDCMLKHGAVKVYAVDVGKGLLNWYDKRDLKWEISTSERASYVMSLPNLQLNAEFRCCDFTCWKGEIWYAYT